MIGRLARTAVGSAVVVAAGLGWDRSAVVAALPWAVGLCVGGGLAVWSFSRGNSGRVAVWTSRAAAVAAGTVTLLAVLLEIVVPLPRVHPR